jgi:hypothetical protein
MAEEYVAPFPTLQYSLCDLETCYDNCIFNNKKCILFPKLYMNTAKRFSYETRHFKGKTKIPGHALHIYCNVFNEAHILSREKKLSRRLLISVKMPAVGVGAGRVTPPPITTSLFSS